MQHELSEDQSRHTNEFFPEKSSTRTGILLQLFLTHGMTSAIALALVWLLPHLGGSSSISTIGAIVLSGALGLLLTANILHDLHHVERTVTDIYRGHATVCPTFSWPLTPLFTRLSALDRRVQKHIQEAQAAAEMRRQYLQQASESATRTERQRIARDLHDTIKQQLFSISVSAATAQVYWSKDLPKAQAAIVDIQQVVKEAQVEMQALLQQLGSTLLENTKLADALRTQAEALKYRSGLEMSLTIGDLPPDELLPEGTRETIFRLVQEAFANIARHARATEVTVTLQQSERALHLAVSDDGQGFDTKMARAGMGLTNMRERVAALGGSIEVQSAVGRGTNIHITVPFLQPQSPVADKIWSEWELKQGMERVTGSFQLGRTALYIALFFESCNGSHLFVQIPIVAIVICLFIAAYGMWQGHTWKVRLLPHLGKEHVDGLRLQQREEKQVFLWIIVLNSAWPSFQGSLQGWEGTYVTVFLSALSILFIPLLIFVSWRCYRRQGRIYRAMARDELQREIKDQRRKVVRHGNILFAAVFAAVIFGGQFASSHPSAGTVHLVIFLCIGGFLIGCYVLLCDLAALWRQRRALGGEQQKEPLVSIWRGE
ncbi:hypothetical protein KSF_078030 [Reticulibacter mediterranei]|uniref:Oxygen sensor histidine kinase NreB n=1 Tax=Reticulibacter mediterranei TaxID=2778369 RepID=A0A8J3IVU6_9CHLR|nr:sensor histidine kinase [Reticulibacter mediterranei]GHO97755.1 hypothetical protein KSF_078030 [Reticulibacter mediterranei]